MKEKKQVEEQNLKKFLKEKSEEKTKIVEILKEEPEPDYSWALKQDPVLEINLKIPFLEDDDLSKNGVREEKLPKIEFHSDSE